MDEITKSSDLRLKFDKIPKKQSNYQLINELKKPGHPKKTQTEPKKPAEIKNKKQSDKNKKHFFSLTDKQPIYPKTKSSKNKKLNSNYKI